MAYSPTPPPSGAQIEQVLDWMRRELETIALEFNSARDTPLNTELHVEPEKPRNGMIVLADGTNWNPGSGRGFYGRVNGAWSKLST